ncbi:lipoprotein precursor [Lactiplantibacillus plantarum]|nr:lipoprotein precursor [Lactiplantibacillus plantarum]
MFRKTAMVAVTAGALTFLLAGCGKTTLSTTKTTYKPNGLVAAVKGKSNVKKVHYQLDGGQTKTATVRNHTFVIQVPTKTTRQTVKIKAGSDTTTVHVKGAKKLVGYQKMATTYNQALIASKLSKSDQQAAKKLQTEGAALKKQQATIQAKVKQAQAQIKAGGTAAATGAKTLQAQQTAAAQLKTKAASLQTTQKQVEAAMATAKKQVKSQLLPTKTPSDGITNVLTTKDYKIRLNVQKGDVLGAAMIVPTKAFKNKTRQKNFGTAFALMTTTTGANAKKVMKQFQKETKNNSGSTTTIDPITSKGVRFTIGVSTSDLYIFMTK